MAAQVLIDVDGNFNKDVARDLHLADENCRVGAVSVVGVQGTGKSTLLNSCFSTKFPELDQRNGMARTTKGIGIAVGQSPKNAGHKILVLDIEGTDGLDRGRESDNAFESQTTLFSLAMSNTVIFNMKCDSVNLHQGSSSPLMETVFQVMLRRFSTPRHINLLFVLRDRNMCPLEVLRLQLIKQLTEIWDRMSNDTVNAALEDYFKIDVLAMPHYRLEREEFDTEVVKMRERIFSLVKLGQLDSASGFIALAERNWMDITADQILNLSFNRIQVAESLCNQISMEKIVKFRKDQSWIQIEKDVESGMVAEGFGNDVSTIIGGYISQYDEETLSLDGSHRLKHKDQLTKLLLKEVRPAYLSRVRMAGDTTRSDFQKKIVENIRNGSSAFEESELDKYISQYRTLLDDAYIKQANWVPVDSEQLERLTSELASFEKAGLYIVTQRTLLKVKKDELKEMMIGGSLLAAIGFTGFSAFVAVNGFIAASLAVHAFGSIAAVMETIAGYVSTTGITTSAAAPVIALMSMYRDYLKIKREFEETCKQDPIVGSLNDQAGS